jgi:raffinose/stachyose/melibiose transport system permease protein
MYLRTRRRTPFLFILPMLLLLLFIYGYSLVSVFDFSFRRVRGITGEFIGFANYLSVFRDPSFQQAIVNNFTLFLLIPLLVAAAVLFSVLLYEQNRGWQVHRVLLFLPYILAIPVIGIVFGYMFTLNGVVNTMLRAVGLPGLAIDWLGSPRYALWTLMLVIFWKEAGFGIVLFLARLMSVDEALYDAAAIDGAGWWRKLFSVTIPQLGTIIEFFSVVTLINMLSWVFSYSYTITMGGPGWRTIVMELFIYNKLARSQVPSPGLSSAASVVLFLVTIIFIVASVRFRRREDLE